MSSPVKSTMSSFRGHQLPGFSPLPSGADHQQAWKPSPGREGGSPLGSLGFGSSHFFGMDDIGYLYHPISKWYLYDIYMI